MIIDLHFLIKGTYLHPLSPHISIPSLNPTFNFCPFTFFVPATLCLLSLMNFIASSSFFHCDLLGGSIGTRRVLRIPWISSGSRDMLKTDNVLSECQHFY